MKPTATSDSLAFATNSTIALVDRQCFEKCSINASMLVNLTECTTTISCNQDCHLHCTENFNFNAGDEGALFTLGNVVSLCGLLATFVTYCTFGELRKSNNGKYLLNLIAALFVAKLAFQVRLLCDKTDVIWTVKPSAHLCSIM